MFQNDDVTVKESRIQGNGVFATRDFKKREIVLNWNPKFIEESDIEKLSDQEKHYISKVNGKILLMQPPERYVNHSCDPNTKPVNQSDMAIKNIKKGEEITSDYNGTSNPSFICNCGSKNCKGLFIDSKK